MYCIGDNLKKSSPLVIHYNYIYSLIDGSFARKAHSRVENNPVVIYSIENRRLLNWKNKTLLSPNGQMIQYFLNRRILIVIPSLLLIN